MESLLKPNHSSLPPVDSASTIKTSTPNSMMPPDSSSPLSLSSEYATQGIPTTVHGYCGLSSESQSTTPHPAPPISSKLGPAASLGMDMEDLRSIHHHCVIHKLRHVRMDIANWRHLVQLFRKFRGATHLMQERRHVGQVLQKERWTGCWIY